MNVLDSSFEVLAINYASFGFFTLVNNLWAWVAVMTAAVSFWRLRAAGAGATTSSGFNSDTSSSTHNDESSNGSMLVSEIPPSIYPEELPSTTSCVSPSKASSASVLGNVEEIGVTKGEKFTLYYEDDGDLTALTEDIAGEAVIEECCSEWWESWEKILKLRTGELEMGWNRYQDLTKLNGNVVRLWDDCGTKERKNNSGLKPVRGRLDDDQMAKCSLAF
ncbi:hypothetical protein UlMin_021905 [Ulmus minor]